MIDTAERLAKQQLGQPAGELTLSGRQEFRAAGLRLARQSVRSLDILSFDLDAPVYDQQDFVAAVKQFCLQSRQSQVRILLQNNERVQKQGHRLLELARRLPSSISIHRPHPDYLNHQENVLLADRTGYLLRRLHSRYQGTVDFCNRLGTQRLSDFFSEIWHCSEPDVDLRRLDI